MGRGFALHELLWYRICMPFVLILSLKIALYTHKLKNLKYAPQIRLKNMGFIYQHHHLLGDFTAQENAAMPLLISIWKLSATGPNDVT